MSEGVCPECRGGRFLVEEMAKLGCEVHVQPFHIFIRPNGYEQPVYGCPVCKTPWLVEPTNDQILRWREDGVR